MSTSANHDHPPKNPQLVDFPALASLGITEGELAELARQGFVCPGRRGNNAYHKLRFRFRGKQIVRYVGDAARAAAVQKELAILQHDSKIKKKLKAKTKLANQALRDSKRLLEPVLKAHGLMFHGYAIRTPRPRLDNISDHDNS